MATLVRKKAKPKQRTHQELTDHPLVASGAPYRGNGGTSSNMQEGGIAHETSPIKIHVSPDDLLLMENFNGQSPVTPSAPEIDILRDSKHNEQLDHWEAIMMGSPMTPPMSMDPNHMRQPDEFSLTGENPPSSSETATAPVQLNGQSPDSSPSFLETQVPPVERKYTLPPASVTISSVADLLAPSKSSRLHLTAPVYPVLAQLKPIVLPQSHRVVAPQPYMERPLLPLQEVPRVPLRRFEHYDDHVHLRDLSLRHYEERSRAIETAPDDFYRLVEAYLHFDHALRQAHVQLLQRIADVDERRANVWTIDFESASTSALCGDLKTIDESVEYQTASLNPQLQANLADALGQLRQLRTAEASLHVFDRALGFLRVELAVDVVVEGGDMGSIQTAMDTLFFFEKHLTTPRFMGTVPSSVRRGQLVLDKQAKGLVCHACGHITAISSSAVRVVSCGRCDALGFVPHTTIALSSKEFTAAVAQVRRSIQHWLTRCMAKLHQLSSTPHDENMAQHGKNVAQHGKNVAQHGQNVAQHGKDEAVMPWLIAHLLHLPGLALERQWAVGFVHFAPPSAWTVATLDHFLAMMHLLFHPAVLPMQYAADDDVGVGGETSPPPDEWLLMELPSHGELSLLDADYVLLWRQFPLDTALSHCMTLAPHDAYSRLLYLVNECTVVFEKFADYDQLVTSVSDALGKILMTASQTSHGSLFDQLFQIGLFGVVMARSPKVYTSLPSWAYHALSPSGQWDALSAFFFQPSIPSSALKAYIPFTCFLNDHPSLRLRFYHEVSRNQALLAALGVLASHTPWSELVQTIVHELFLCYMATPDTLLDAHVRTLSGVCTAHPCALSQLLTLVCHHDTGMAVLPQLPIRLWHPTEADLGVFQAWLMLDHVHDPKSQLVRTLLDRMNWGYLDDQSQLALHPTVHRHVALLLVDATVHHSTNVTWSSRLVAFDFAQWSWQLVLKLHFYSPRTYQPYLTLIRLDSDLTRHAMILRRYAKSLPKSHVVLGKAEHAMDSHSCISYVEPGTTSTTTSTMLVHPEEDEDGVVPLAEMQPIVLYVVCQITDHLYSTCIDKFAPLLSLVLDHNRPVAVLQVLENILPTLSQTPLNYTDVHTFVKNYLDNNADWRSIVRVLAKNWYFLPDLAKSTLVDQLLANDDTGGISQILPVIVSTLEQSVCVHPALLPALLGQLPSPSWMQSAMSTLLGFKSAVLQQPRTAFVSEVVHVIRRQYLHTNLHSNVLLVWLVVVMGVPNWSDAPVYRQLVDSVIECALVHRPDTAMVELEAPFRLYLDHMCAVFPTSSLSFVPTCVPPSTSSYYVSSVMFRGHPPNVELYLGFLSLLVEIRKEKELFKALGHIVLKSKLKVKSLDTLRAKGRLATELYVFGIDTSQPTLYGHLDLQFHSWHTLKLFKVALFVLQHRESSHPVDLLLWQLLFALYFASVGSDCFGFLMLELHPHTRKALQTKCRQLSNAYSAQIGDRSKADELARTYAAMETWLEHPDVSTWLHQIDHLPRHYNTAQLKQVLGLSHALLHTTDTIDMTSTTIWEDIAPFLWLPLCDFAYTTPATAAPLSSSSDPPTPPPPPPSLCPSPLPFHAPKYVRFSPVVSIDTMQSVELRTEPFHDRATVYADAVATLATLEAEFLDHLNGLYQPKHRVVHTSRPCDGTSHEPCKRPAALHLEYTEWTVDADRVERIAQFHIQSAKLDLWTTDIPTVPPSVGMMVDRTTSLGLTPLDVQVCYQILMIDQMVALLTQSPDQFQSMGVQWFHKLLHLDTKATRGFPPFQEVLWRSIKRLGATFVNADETTGLLRFMLQDSARVCLLADCFFPNQTPTRFVEYFASIMHQSEHLESADRLELLSRFDIALWLDHDPILFDRDTLVSIVLAELVLGNAKLDILRMHAKMIHVLASRYLDDHVDKIVCALLGVYDVHYAADLHAMRSYCEVPPPPPSKALDVSIWHALLNIPPSCWSRCKVVPQLVDRVAQFVLHARTKASQAKQGKDISALLITTSAAYPMVMWHSDQAILQPLCDLMLLWIKASPPDTLWPIATKLFEAFLTVLYTPGPTPDATTIVEPWPPTEESADQVLCHALQATFTLYLDLPPSDVDASARLDNIWQFYRRVLLPHASDALAGSYNAVLSHLPWSLWGISEDTLNEMKEGVVPSVQTTTATKSANFKYQSPLRPNVLLLVQTILAQVPWSRIAAHLADQPPHVMSSFYIKYHVLLCHVLLLVDAPSSPQKSYLLPRPVKVAEVEAICNGVSALLLHPSVLCVPPRTDASPRFYATFGLLLSLCGLQLTNGTASGDELKKAAAVLHCLSVFLHPLSPDWKQNFPAFESTMLGLVQAALRSVLDLVMLLHAQVDTLDRTFKADHVTALYCDIFKLCNLPFISQASLIVDSTLSTSTSSSTSWMELEAKVSVAIPSSSQECTMLSLDKCMPWSVVGWQLLWQFAGLSKSLPAICVSVASVSVLCQLTERNLSCWNMSTWPQLKLPELSQDELVITSVKHQCWLTLLAFAKQQRFDADVQRQLHFSMRMNEWVEEIAAAAAISDQAKLVGVILALLARLLAMPGVAVTFKRDMVARMSKACWSMGDARQLSNGLDAVQRAMGFNFMNSFGKLKHSAELHVAMLALSLFMRVNSRKSAVLRLDYGAPLEVSKKTLKLIKTMEGMPERKEVVQWSIAFCQDPKRCLRDLDEFAKVLITELYPAHVWMLPLVKD